MIERKEEKERLKEERRTWREVEARMRAENEEAELKAAYERRKAEERARAVVPDTAEVKEAWKSLGVASQKSTTTFEPQDGDGNGDLQPLVESKLDEPSVDDGDLFEAVDPVQVRQDRGVQFGADEPDWELIEKLEEIADKDEIVVPDVPEAPDLEAAARAERSNARSDGNVLEEE